MKTLLTQANDFENLREKLNGLGYNGSHKDDESLVQALVAVHLTLETFELSEAARGAVLDLLSTTGREQMGAAPDFTEESWQSFDYGNVKLDSFVRVKHDAYDSETGVKHNGLVGILTAMSGGVCTVDYIGLASGSRHRHSMEKLDSLKAVYNRRLSQK